KSGRRHGRLGCRLFCGVNAHGLRRLVVVDEAVEARGRSSGDQRAGLEPADGWALPPDGPPQLGDSPVRGHDYADEEERSERDRRADLTEEARRRFGDGAANEPAGNIVADVMAGKTEERPDDEQAPKEREHRLAKEEAEPEL